ARGHATGGVTSTGASRGAVTADIRGCVLSIVVAPRASFNALEQLVDGTLRVRLTAPPVDGAANDALLRFLSDLLDVPRSRLAIAAGPSRRRKRILVTGLSPEETASQLARALGHALCEGDG